MTAVRLSVTYVHADARECVQACVRVGGGSRMKAEPQLCDDDGYNFLLFYGF